MQTPRPGPSESIGSYSSGCLYGADALDVSTENYELMRPGRGRFWGHKQTIDALEEFAQKYRMVNRRKVIIGDLGLAQGGPSLTGHSSHQTGLDADIWLKTLGENETFSLRERQMLSATSVLEPNQRKVDQSRMTKDKVLLIKMATEIDDVQRIFIHPAIKVHMCEHKEMLKWKDEHFKKLRPWWGHHYHMHLRFKCPVGDGDCEPQADPEGIECGVELDFWFKPGQGLNEPGSDKKIDYVDRYHKRVKKLPPACKM